MRLLLAAAAASVMMLAAVLPAVTQASPRAPYVVVLAPAADCPAAIASVSGGAGVRVTATYTSAFCGFAAKLTATEAAALAADRAVASVTPDTPVAAF